MMGELDPVEGGVTQVHVGAGHVDLGPKDHRTLRVLALAHLFEEGEVFRDGTVPPGAVLAGLGEGAAILLQLLGAEFIDEGLSLLDEAHGDLVKLAVVVGGVVLMFPPIEAEPMDVPFDGLDVLELLLLGVGIVVAQITAPLVLLCQTEVQADRLDVADVQISVRFRGKPGDDHIVRDPAGGKVILDDSL